MKQKKRKLKREVRKSWQQKQGKIFLVKHSLECSGKTKTDLLNTEKELRNKSLFGMKILSDMEFAHDNIWDSGKIYDPESGNTYSCRIKMISNKIVVVRGYIFIPLIGRDEVCYRVDK